MNINIAPNIKFNGMLSNLKSSKFISDDEKKDCAEKLKKNGLIVTGCTGMTVGAFGLYAIINGKRCTNKNKIAANFKNMIKI